MRDQQGRVRGGDRQFPTIVTYYYVYYVDSGINLAGCWYCIVIVELIRKCGQRRGFQAGESLRSSALNCHGTIINYDIII